MSGSIIVRPTVSPTFASYEGQSLWKGEKFTAAPGVATNHDFKILIPGSLFGGSYWTDGNTTIGDYLEFCVIDIDGIVAPPGTVLAKYVETMYVVPNERRDLRSGQAAEIIAGLYLRSTYHSIGASPIEVLTDFLIFQQV